MRLTPEQLQAEIGKRYGQLTVIEHRGRNRRGQNAYLCQCDCGGFRVVTIGKLRIGAIEGVRACETCARRNRAAAFVYAAHTAVGSEDTVPRGRGIRGLTFQGGNPGSCRRKGYR